MKKNFKKMLAAMICLLMLFAATGFALAQEQNGNQPDETLKAALQKQAVEVLQQRYLIEPVDLSIYNVEICSMDGSKNDTESVWRVEFHHPINSNLKYQVEFAKDGRVTGWAAPGEAMRHMNPEDTDALLASAKAARPAPGDIPEDQAITHAQGDLTEVIGLSPSKVAELKPSAHFLSHEALAGENQPVWLVLFHDRDHVLQYKSLLDPTGKHLGVRKAGQEFGGGFTLELPNWGVEELYKFPDMSIEEKASLTDKMRPIVNQYLASHPNYTRAGDVLYHATRYVYGLPAEEELSQEKALALARKAIRDAKVKDADARDYWAFFDITNPDRHLWKFTFLINPNVGGRPWRVELNAASGAIETLYEVAPDCPADDYTY